jgi:cytochrome P450
LAGVVAAAGAVLQLRTKHDLARLVKLDSFLKESQRMNLLTRFTFKRIVTAPAGITLRDATHLPRDMSLGATNPAFAQWVASHEFRSFRFFEQAHTVCSDRGSSGNTGRGGGGGGGANGSSTANSVEATETAPHVRRSQPQYVSTSVDSMHFGLGKYVCPGRLFAARQLKLIMAHQLLRYNMELPPGTGWPRNIESNVTSNPDLTKYVLMKRRAGVSV